MPSLNAWPLWSPYLHLLNLACLLQALLLAIAAGYW